MTPISIYLALLNENFIEAAILNKTSVDLIIYIKYYFDNQNVKHHINFQKKV